MMVRNKNRLVFVIYGILLGVFVIKSCHGYLSKPVWNKHDFKILVEPGTEECFYHTIVNGSVLHVSFQLIQGDDINFYITNPDGNEVFRANLDTRGTHQIGTTPHDGDYKICVDNRYSAVFHKLVYMYLLSFHAVEIKQKFQNEKDFNATADVILKSTVLIYTRLLDVFTQQALMRFRQARDDYIVEANNEIVMYWSLFQSFIIICCGLFQAYFIKRLFLVNSSNPSKSKYNY